jgi:GTPase SAR1 family protein
MMHIKNHAPKDVKVILAGNKSDLESERRIATDEGIKMARNYDIPFYECSAKTAGNVNEIFEKMANEVLVKLEKAKMESSVFNFKTAWRLNNDEEGTHSTCCKN